MSINEVTAPLPIRRPGRAVRIATVHGLAAWLSAHADVDTPDWVTAVRQLDARDHRDAGVRVRAVEAFARAHELPLGEDALHVWAAVPLGTTPVHGVAVRYVLQTAKCEPWIVHPPTARPGTDA